MSRPPQPPQRPSFREPPARPGRYRRGRSAVVALALALFLGVSGARAGAVDRVAGPAFGDVDDIKVGDCFNTDDDFTEYEGEEGQAPLSVDTVPCARPHQAEAFAVVRLPDGPYPGVEKVQSIADEKCGGKALGDYAGKAAKLPKTMEVYYYYPVQATWTLGEHEITCFVSDEDGASAGSVRAGGS
ncbi:MULTISPECIES: septum formation family protein [unclassified Streptomyces]|uniref:septum formation family protein n=1 Tax=unclassified Streptomyces TaxID=2593676 RepID=UPI002251A3D5|nr:MULTISPECIES: septum formation family protein [unclassified Streptomyces]MCX4528767.1 septum formation family protein [Streptomyces sp. NBC_01551]MCX4540625.1 septum formation family protein [Streptomyces sp. NBC_01565]